MESLSALGCEKSELSLPQLLGMRIRKRQREETECFTKWCLSPSGKASGCDSDMRGFDPHQTPQIFSLTNIRGCAIIALFFKNLSGCVT